MAYRVLVVEDNLAFLKYVKQQLTYHGFDVVTATTLTDTAQLLEADNNFFCVILDYCLPDAENGEVVDLALQAAQRIVVLSAAFRKESRDQLIQKGVLDYILKDSPAWVADLLLMLQRLKNNGKHHALVIDDSQVVRRHLSQLLEHQFIRTSVATDGLNALEIIRQNPDISFIITDHAMPKMDGITFTRTIRKTKDKNVLPILGLSASDDSTMTARFLKAGANDFLYKPFNQEELYCRIHNLLGMKEANDELYRLANEDDLTGLWNRRYFFSQAGVNESTCVAMLDIDLFKRVNDNYGHDCGDKVIRTVADVLKVHFDKSGLTRLGGEEFCVLYRGGYPKFLRILEKMRERIEKLSIPYDDQQINITISIGATQQDSTLAAKLRIADKLLYKAKQQGRNLLIHD